MFEVMTWPRNPWSIFNELESLQDDVNRLFGGRARGAGEGNGHAWRRRTSYPPMNVWSSEEGLIIDAELPGVDPKDVEISVLGDQLTLHGKVNVAEPPEGENYHRRERPSGEFSRTLQLPFRADPESVKANYTNGVLRLTVPRAEDEKPRKITIEAA
jgi:HSP20 family protein